MGNSREDRRGSEIIEGDWKVRGERLEGNGISKKPASGLFSPPGYQVTGCPINGKSEAIGENRRGSERSREKEEVNGMSYPEISRHI